MKNGVRNIQATAYNGARTVFKINQYLMTQGISLNLVPTIETSDLVEQ